MIDDSALHQGFWDKVTPELRRVIHEETFDPGGGQDEKTKKLFVQDRFLLGISPISAEPIDDVFSTLDPGVVASTTEPLLGNGNISGPYIREKRVGNHHERDVYFRVLNVQLYDGFTLNIGMQIEEEVVQAAFPNENLTQVQTGKLLDRHEHFHVISDSPGGNGTPYFVYSPNGFRAREVFV